MASWCTPQILKSYFGKRGSRHRREGETQDQFERRLQDLIERDREHLSLFRDDLMRLFGCLTVTSISGTITITDLAAASYEDVVVDHSDEATFRVAEYPRFSGDTGITVQVLGLATISGAAYATNATAFVVRVTNNDADYTYSGDLSWQRHGIIQRQP